MLSKLELEFIDINYIYKYIFLKPPVLLPPYFCKLDIWLYTNIRDKFVNNLNKKINIKV